MFAGQSRTELGVGNRLLLAEEKLPTNTRLVQARNDIELVDASALLAAWELFDGPAKRARRGPNFSVEMETGTGKTYDYLRTIFELTRRYGFLGIGKVRFASLLNLTSYQPKSPYGVVRLRVVGYQ